MRFNGNSLVHRPAWFYSNNNYPYHHFIHLMEKYKKYFTKHLSIIRTSGRIRFTYLHKFIGKWVEINFEVLHFLAIHYMTVLLLSNKNVTLHMSYYILRHGLATPGLMALIITYTSIFTKRWGVLANVLLLLLENWSRQLPPYQCLIYFTTATKITLSFCHLQRSHIDTIWQEVFSCLISSSDYCKKWVIIVSIFGTDSHLIWLSLFLASPVIIVAKLFFSFLTFNPISIASRIYCVASVLQFELWHARNKLV